MVRLTISAVVSAIVAALHAASPASAQDIEIGIAAPLTGPVAAYGAQISVGARAAVDLINRAGGVLNGRRLAVREMDDGCDPGRAQAAAIALAEAKVVAVVGHYCTLPARLAMQIYGPVGIPMVTLAGDPALTGFAQQFGFANLFRIVGQADRQGLVAGVYLARRFDAGPLALVHERNAFTNILAENVRDGLTIERPGATIESIEADSDSVSAVVARLARLKPAAVYLATAPVMAGAIVKGAKDAGVDTVFVSSGGAAGDAFLTTAGGAARGVLTTSPMDARALESARAAVAALRERRVEPEGFTLYAWSAVQVVAAAIEAAQSTEPARLADALHRQSVEAVIGKVQFDRTGELAGDLGVAPFGFTQWRENRNVAADTSPYWDYPHETATLRRLQTLPRLAAAPPERPGDIVREDKLPSAVPLPRMRPGWRARARAPQPSTPFTARALQGVFWNTFLTQDKNKDARLNVRSNATYMAVLDLSAYNYRQITATNAAGTEVAPAVLRYLAQAPREPVEMRIRPVTVTPQITIDDLPVKPMEIERSKLVRPRDGEAARAEEQLVADFNRGRLKVADMSGKVAAGQVRFQVRLKKDAKAGCAIIAFTIWDFHDNPIDHLLQTVPIDDGTTRTDCAASGAEALKGGLATLLDPAFTVGPGTDKTFPIEAAFHLFEAQTRGEKLSYAIFIDKTEYVAPQPGKPDSERGVYAWRLGHWISDYISAANGLPFQIEEAWKAADRGTATAYSQVANELAVKLFGAEPGDEQQAEQAKAALARLAEKRPGAVVIARLVGAENQKYYVPLGLLAGAGNRGGLSRRITVLQPLPQERYGAGRCIRNWSIGMASGIKDLVDGRTKALIDQIAKDPPKEEKWLDNNVALRDYLAEDGNTEAATGEGFVLLAHHDGQGVFIEGPIQRVLAGEFHRQYGRGSIALLASCATGTPNSDMAILNKINGNGMDALIVSPFKVRLDYGARLAAEFTNVVRVHRKKGETPTLAQMFSEAAAAATQYFADKTRKERLEDMALELVLVGDPYLRLCPP